MLKILKNEAEKMIVETDDFTLVNLLNENLWKVRGVRFAGFVKEHPYLANPKIVLNAANPKDALIKAAERIVKDVEELKKQI